MKNYLKFWGTRGSCSVSGPEYRHFGGNTCCLEVNYEETHLIIDAGTGIRPLGEALKKRKIDLFLSHFHWDHIMGFPFFEPLYQKGIEITIWSPARSGRSSHALFDQVLAEEFFPVHLDQMLAHLEFKTIEKSKPLQLGPVRLSFHPTHHPGLTYCFKIETPHETISYVTDNEIHVEDESFIAFHKNVDYFIHEAQYFPEEYQRKKGWGHSSLAHAIALVNQVQPARWLVTHHDPRHGDAELKKLEESAQSSQLSCPVEWIPDGYILNLK